MVFCFSVRLVMRDQGTNEIAGMPFILLSRKKKNQRILYCLVRNLQVQVTFREHHPLSLNQQSRRVHPILKHQMKSPLLGRLKLNARCLATHFSEATKKTRKNQKLPHLHQSHILHYHLSSRRKNYKRNRHFQSYFGIQILGILI